MLGGCKVLWKNYVLSTAEKGGKYRYAGSEITVFWKIAFLGFESTNRQNNFICLFFVK